MKGSTDDVISGTGKILNTSATDKHYRVLLEIMSFTGNVAGNFNSVGETYSRDLTKCGVRLLRGRSLNSGANATLLR
jgi:hypothetical protein